MALWMVRAGKPGEYEARFFSDGRIYHTWEELTEDLLGLTERWRSASG